MGKMFIVMVSAFPIPTDVEYKWTNTSYTVASCATTNKTKQTSILKIVNLKMK